MLTMCRPARVLSCEIRLDAEYRSARWIHHRLLDFEDEHQRVLDAAAAWGFQCHDSCGPRAGTRIDSVDSGVIGEPKHGNDTGGADERRDCRGSP